jgi:hypothetical protein
MWDNSRNLPCSDGVYNLTMRQFLAVVVTAVILKPADLPVREVIIYKNGVGYFERAGDVPAGETARLAFKASEMNDVLKSLTVRDEAGGRVAGLRYESAEPLEQKLATFSFAEGETISFSAFLHQLRGAKLTVTFGGDKLSGVIVLARAVAAEKIEREQLVLLLDSGVMRTIDLGAATGLQFDDMALQAQLRDYLRILAGARSQDKRTVSVESVDSGTRKLVASYMVPSPVWKSSYRLIFADSGEPTLEGWAVVDNTTGEDWTKVSLALVSGRPISFISQLYEPKHVGRVEADLPEYAAVNPTLHEGAIGVVGGVPGGVAGGAPGGIVGGIMGAVPSAAPPPPPVTMKSAPREFTAPTSVAVRQSNVVADSTTREFADLFEYRFSHPVTVRAGESAMLPFLQQKIGARKLLIYSDRSSRHPMSAAELTNSTGKTLDGGPITVFEGGSYSGEALMATLKNTDKRLISYAIDLGTRVTTNLDSSSEGIRAVHFRRGVMTTRTAHRDTQTYSVQNVDNKAKTLIVEHPIRREAKLVSPKPAETTATAYRFELKLGPNAAEKVAVVEEREFDNAYTVSNLNSDFLLSYVRNQTLSATARGQLEKLAALKIQVEQIDRSARQAQTDITNLERDQDRLRQNINSLNQVSGQQDQVGRYARALAEQETKLTALRDQQSDLAKRKTALETEISGLIDKMEF